MYFWTASLPLSPKAILYKTFISALRAEHCLPDVKITKSRTAITQLRCTSHELNIEKGRYTVLRAVM